MACPIPHSYDPLIRAVVPDMWLKWYYEGSRQRWRSRWAGWWPALAADASAGGRRRRRSGRLTIFRPLFGTLFVRLDGRADHHELVEKVEPERSAQRHCESGNKPAE